MIMDMSSATNPGFGIWDLAWNLAIRVKLRTYEQNWDFYGTKIWDFHSLRVCFSSVLKMFNAVNSSDLLQMSCTETNSLNSTSAESPPNHTVQGGFLYLVRPLFK